MDDMKSPPTVITVSKGNRKTFMLHVYHSDFPLFLFHNRSSYPDKKEGEDAEMDDEDLPDDKSLEYDDETLELTLPSGELTVNVFYVYNM